MLTQQEYSGQMMITSCQDILTENIYGLFGPEHHGLKWRCHYTGQINKGR